MAQGRRVERVASLIRREISELLTTNIRDARVHQGLVSVTSVEVAGDLLLEPPSLYLDQRLRRLGR